MKKKLSLLIISIFLNLITLPAQEQNQSAYLQRLSLLKGDDFRTGIGLFYDSLRKVNDIDQRIKVANSVFELTNDRDPLAHIRSLMFRARYTDQEASPLFEEAWELASAHHDIKEMRFVEYGRSKYYIARQQYDSAMMHILHYRDISDPEADAEGYRNITQLLGDVYYHAGLLDRARNTYQTLYDDYTADGEWNYYRPYVMMNNLGQIAMQTGSTMEALDWFSRSLSRADSQLNMPYRDNTMAYTRLKLAQLYIKQNEFSTADSLLQLVSQMTSDRIQEDVWQELLMTRTLRSIAGNNWNEALHTALMLSPGDTVSFSEFRFVPEIYRILADIYSHMGEQELAWKYLKKHDLLDGHISAGEHTARSMVLLADRNYAATQEALESSRHYNFILIATVLLLIVVVGIILILYRKLYHSRLVLVRKSLEAVTLSRVSIPQWPFVFQPPDTTSELQFIPPSMVHNKEPHFVEDKTKEPIGKPDRDVQYDMSESLSPDQVNHNITDDDQNAETPEMIEPGFEKTENNGMEVTDAKQEEALIKELKTLMETELPFLDASLSLDGLARRLNTNRTYLSKAINQRLGTNFSNYINDFRIREAINLIQNGYTVQHTQEALARECGFSNRQAFTRAFKRQTGVLPSFFMANYKK